MDRGSRGNMPAYASSNRAGRAYVDPHLRRKRMKRLQWAGLVLAGSLLLSIGSCMSDLGYTLISYLPDLLETWLGTSTTTA